MRKFKIVTKKVRKQTSQCHLDKVNLKLKGLGIRCHFCGGDPWTYPTDSVGRCFEHQHRLPVYRRGSNVPEPELPKFVGLKQTNQKNQEKAGSTLKGGIHHYSVSRDFEGVLDTRRLYYELRGAALVALATGVTRSGDDVEITFREALSDRDKTALARFIVEFRKPEPEILVPYREAFIYGSQPVYLAPGGTVTTMIATMRDAPFYCGEIRVNSTGPCSWLIRDSSSDRQWSNISLSTQLTKDNRLKLGAPRRIAEASNITIEITDISLAHNEIRFALSGYHEFDQAKLDLKGIFGIG